MSAPTVFISYSHRDEKWKDKLLPFLKALEQAGVAMAVWQDRQIDAGAEWHPAIQEAMADAGAAVLLISADYLASGFCVKEEVHLLERQEGAGMLLIPVLIRRCPWKAHRWLAARQMLPRDGKCVAIDFPDDHADVVFSEVAELVLAHFERLSSPSIPASGRHLILQCEIGRFVVEGSPVDFVLQKRSQASETPTERIDLSRLPETGAALFGRDDELSLLDKVWAGEGPSADGWAARVVAFKAQGGVGKSTLINHWLAEMRRDHFRGATRAFGWSFYSQGVREQGAPSADTFVAAALRFFGDEAMAASPASAWEKGERLARLVGTERALLVLDGMEPLQSAQPFERGKLQDPALESLLRGLARHSAGLCIITTREPLAELGRKAGIVERDLEQITPQAGRALLRATHVDGTDAELETLAERFGPHALAISLLAVYLHEQPGQGIWPALDLETMPGATPVDRVLAGFERWLGNSAELEAVSLLGFFNRPANEGCLRALREPPAIPGLTDAVAGMADTDWQRVLARLEKLRLVHVRQSDSGKRSVDTHPLIREYFAGRVREPQPEAWRAAHRRLYEHLCASTHEGDAPTLEDLQPLYQAVAHGCQAGLYDETHDDVFFSRIFKRQEYYTLYKLGAFGSDLGAMACFFDSPWNRVNPTLHSHTQSSLLVTVAFCLRAIGRLNEALAPTRLSLDESVASKNWKHAAIRASNLSELELTLGQVAGAVVEAEQSVFYADRSGDAFMRVVTRTKAADALHQVGRLAEAETHFREAELMQAKDQPDYPLLVSLRGFLYCDLLLAAPARAAWRVGNAERGTRNAELIEVCRAVSQRAAQTLEWGDIAYRHSLLDIALDRLTLGRAALYETILGRAELLFGPNVRDAQQRVPTEEEWSTARRELDSAVAGLRRANSQDHMPRGLLTRAWLRFLTGARTGSESAQEDLDEAWEIAERGPMKLLLADIHLHRARLFFREKEYPKHWISPQTDLAAARKLIERCGYWRRKEELEDAEAALKMS